jgi:putative transposase
MSMATALSVDLRERVVAQFRAGGTLRSVAKTFSVSPSSVSKWSAQERRTGSLVPGKCGGGKRRVLCGDHAEWLGARIRDGQGFTLKGLVFELGERGLDVKIKAVWTFVHEEGLSFKKKRTAQ